MGRKTNLPAAAVLSVFLAACALPLLTLDQSKQLCQVAVHEKFGPPTFIASPAAHPVIGPAMGLVGAVALVGAGALIVLAPPIGASFFIMPGSYGAFGTDAVACSIGRLAHPSAEADFERVLRTADTGVLARSLESTINAPRDECARVRADRAPDAGPDSRIEVQEIRVGTGCMYGQMEYWVTVRWSLLNVQTGKEVTSDVTRCSQKSFRGIEDWFAHPDRARAEIEGVLAATGRHMTQLLLARDSVLPQCNLASNEANEVMAR